MGSSVILPPTGQPTPGPDKGFTSAFIPKLVSFAIDGISPPSTLYIERDDVLQLYATTDQTIEQVIFRVRFLPAAADQPGQPGTATASPADQLKAKVQTIKIVEQRFAFPILPGITVKDLNLGEGYLLSVSAVCTSAQDRGRTYAGAQLVRSTPGNPIQVQQLFADYITSQTATTWPGGRMLHPSESTGFSKSFNVVNPAAGADFVMVVPAGLRFQAKSFSATFVASASVATRNISVIVDDGANIVWQTDVTAGVTAGQTVAVSGTTTNAAVGIVATTLFVVIPPGLYLPAGWRIRTNTANIQGGDQWSNIWFAIEQWLASF